MNTIEIIGIVIASIGTILGGVWLILSKVFKMGQTAERIDRIEKSTEELKDNMDRFPCSSHHDDITKIKTILVD